MLISAARCNLSLEDPNGAVILLSDWLRAPLFLSEGARYYAALETKILNNSNLELVISAFDHTLWDDLWRIEVDTDDAPGNTALLFSLLQDRGLRILSAESSINTFNTNHTTAIVVAAHSYESKEDLTSRERDRQNRFELKDLRRDILVYLGDQIAFNPDGAPSLKIRRFNNYKKLSEELQNGSRFVLNRNGETIKGSNIFLTGRAIGHLRRELAGADTSYSAAVDTKDRLIRVIFFGSEQPRVNYTQLLIHGESKKLASDIYHSIFELGGNVVRTQMRPCPDSLIQRRIEEATGQKTFLDQLPVFMTLDVTFSFPSQVTDRGWKQSVARLDANMKKLAEINSGQLFVERRSWENDGRKTRLGGSPTERDTVGSAKKTRAAIGNEQGSPKKKHGTRAPQQSDG